MKQSNNKQTINPPKEKATTSNATAFLRLFYGGGVTVLKLSYNKKLQI